MMQREDGVENATKVFYKHLPTEQLVCDISIFCGESRLAQVYCAQCGLKMCFDVSDVIHGPVSFDTTGADNDDGGQNPVHSNNNRLSHDLYLCSYVNWEERRPHSTATDIYQGLTALVGEVAGGFTNAIKQPAAGLMDEGLQGKRWSISF
jgi:hypothetical protein